MLNSVAYKPDFTRRALEALFMAVLVLAVATRAFRLDAAGLWPDELWGVDACALGSWWAMVLSMISIDTHPPGYQTMLYFWIRLVGEGDAAVRLPSMLAGVLAVHALYRFATQYWNPFTALVAALLLAVSYNGIYYSQEARAYIFLVLFGIWYWHLLCVLFIDKQATRWHWCAFWLVTTLLCYFHYMGSLIVFSGFVVVWLVPDWRPGLLASFKAWMPMAVAFAPWLPVMWYQVANPDPSWQTAAPDMKVLLDTALFIWGPSPNLFAFCFTTFAGWFVFVAVQLARGRLSLADKRLLGVLAMVLLPWLAFYVKSLLSESIYTVRHFIYAIPVMMLITARVISLLWQRFWPQRGVATLALCLTGFAGFALNAHLEYGSLASGKLYSGITRHAYREAVATIVRDVDFMKSERKNVFVANPFFNHYLRTMRVRFKAAPYMHATLPEKFPEYVALIRSKKIQNFYYLEVFLNVETREPSPILQKLQQQYHAVCQTQYRWVQVLKFNTTLPANAGAAVPSCPRSVASVLPAESVPAALPGDL
jgi:mannosyltransferase